MPILPKKPNRLAPLARDHARNKDVKCLRCGAFNIQENHICGKCGASLPIVYDGEGKVFNWREDIHQGSLAGRGAERGPSKASRWTLLIGILLFVSFVGFWYLKPRAPEDFSLLPPALKATAYRAPNGRVAWQRDDLEGALRELSKNGFAVIRARAWVVQEGNIRGTLMFKDTPKMACGWGVEPKGEQETWEGFVQRSLKEALGRVRTTDCGKGVLPEMKDDIYYNIIFADEVRYPKVLRTSSE